MTTLPLRSLAMALAGVAAAAAQDAPPPAEAVAARAATYVDALAAMGQFRGVVLVARGGEVLVHSAHGGADAGADTGGAAAALDRRFGLMSVTKPITATALFALVQAGRLRLEDRLADHLPDWPAAWREVTVLDLLQHTAAIPEHKNAWAAAVQRTGSATRAWAALAPQLADAPLLGPRVGPAGPQRRYTNFNFDLLGLLVETVGGRPFAEQLTATVLRPAGMTGVDVDGALAPGRGLLRDGAVAVVAPPPHGNAASLGLRATARDLHRFAMALTDGALLDAATLAAMWTPRYGDQAAGWHVTRIAGRRCCHHGGRAFGYAAELHVYPDDRACVVVLADCVFAPTARMAADLGRIAFGAAAARPTPLPPARLDAFTGIWGDPDDHALVLIRGGGNVLVYDVHGAPGFCGGALLIPVAGDRLALPGHDGAIAFERDAAGRLARATRHVDGEAAARVLPRRDAPVWRRQRIAGRYVAADGSTVEIDADAGGRPQLRLPHLDATLALRPLSRHLGLALLTDDTGVLVGLDRGGDGRVQAVRWRTREGALRVARRQ